MRDKEIEKMAKAMFQIKTGICFETDCELCDYKEHFDDHLCEHMLIADHLYNAGYRKIDKDSVVFLKEEYDKLKYAWITDSDAYKKGSKETAEKIIDLIKTFCPDKKFVEVITRIISERFGVEIKE